MNLSSREPSRSTNLEQDDFLSWCMRQADLLKKNNFDEVDAIGLAEELESMARNQIHLLRSCYRQLCRNLLNWMPHQSYTGTIEDIAITQQREIIAQLLSASPSLNRLREDLFGQAYEDERRKLTAETNLAIAIAKFPHAPPFSVDDAESSFFWPAG
ncbi:MAG: DUF29 domain-containing protein [Methylovirgula sp.]